MVRWLAAAVMLSLGACDPPAKDSPAAPIVPAAITFDGAEAQGLAAKRAHGERLSWVLGCRGCHGKRLEGKPWIEDPAEGVLHASNLTRVLPRYSDAQLRRLLLTGEHPTRAELWDMPSELFQHLSAADLDALVAHLRTVSPAGEESPLPVVGPAGKAMIERGELKPAARRVAETRNVGPIDLGSGHALGRYITRLTCAECHGSTLAGAHGNPDLIVAGAYSREQFETLITQGEAPAGRKLKPLMTSVAKNRFAKLTQRERDSLYAYLKARAEQPQ